MLVPDRLSSSWSTYHRDVIHCEGLVASDGKRWRIPAIQSERRIAETDCVVQQRYVGCHVLDARTSFGIDNQFPQAVRPSDRPTVRLWRTPPLAGRDKRGATTGSSPAFGSPSVGSPINVPATGKERVGGWKP